MIHKDIAAYHRKWKGEDRAICERLAELIDRGLAKTKGSENKIWHGHPVWFLDGNPIVGYGKLKECIRLLFWSGQSFPDSGLEKEGSFKAAEKRFTAVKEIRAGEMKRWLRQAKEIQWDYKNIVKRKGKLERLK